MLRLLRPGVHRELPDCGQTGASERRTDLWQLGLQAELLRLRLLRQSSFHKKLPEIWQEIVQITKLLGAVISTYGNNSRCFHPSKMQMK